MIRRGDATFYLPIVTCLVLSVVLTHLDVDLSSLNAWLLAEEARPLARCMAGLKARPSVREPAGAPSLEPEANKDLP